MTDYISRADAIEEISKGVWNEYELIDRINAIPSADAVPQSEQYKKGFEDAKRAYEIELARSADANQTNGRLINADALMDLLKARKQFFVDAYGGSFHCMSEKDKARCDEIDACIASIVNAPTVSADAEQVVYCMDCAKSVPLDEHGALWKCKAHDRTTLRHSYCNNGERKGGDTE